MGTHCFQASFVVTLLFLCVYIAWQLRREASRQSKQANSDLSFVTASLESKLHFLYLSQMWLGEYNFPVNFKMEN